jgi:hypothetical protein
MMGLIEQAVRKVLLGESSEAVSPVSEDFGTLHKIVICQRGFVYAGEVRRVGSYLVITKAVNIRRWGTKKGLGELSRKGNQPDTVADACEDVRVHELSVVGLMDCGEVIYATA